MFDFSHPADEVPIPLPQSTVFARAMMRRGVDLNQHALPGGSAMVLMRRIWGLGSVGVVSRGPVWGDHCPKMRAEGVRVMRDALGLSHLFVSPERVEDAAPFQAAGFLQVAKQASVAMLPLAGGPEAQLARMHQKWRNRLRHAEAQGLVVERHEFHGKPDHWLFRIDAQQQKNRGFRNLPHGVVAQMARDMPGCAQLFLARRDRMPVAAMLFLRHGSVASYQIGWSDTAGREASAHNLLLWEAMCALSQAGHHWLDLGLLNPKRTPGIDRFKLGAGAEARVLGGTWLQSAAAAPVHRIVQRLRG